MKTLMKSLLLMGLCLVPVLVFAAPDSPEALGSPDGQVDLFGTGAYGVCRESPPAEVSPGEVSMDPGLSQDCGMESGWEPGTPGNEAGPSSMEVKPGCRRCRDTPWCECTYNGHPRTTCDPCCYQTYTGEICLS